MKFLPIITALSLGIIACGASLTEKRAIFKGIEDPGVSQNPLQEPNIPPNKVQNISVIHKVKDEWAVLAEATEAAGNRLDWFVHDLTEFVGQMKGFDHSTFRRSASVLQREIHDIEFSIETEAEYGALAGRLAFAKHMYRVWVDAAQKLARYKNRKNPLHLLIYEIIDLNVRVWAMHDARGHLDTGLHGNAEKVSFYRYLVAISEKSRNDLKTLPSGILYIYETTLTKTKKMLEEFRRQLPENH